MNLYLWVGIINDQKYSVYSLAKDEASAKEIAIKLAPQRLKNDVVRIVENDPYVFDKTTSFICETILQEA
jgi:hypothetical protein